MADPITDPALLAQLNGPEPKGPVTDPALIAALETHPLADAHATLTSDPPAEKGTLQTIREAIHAPTRALENGMLLGLGDRARAVINTVVSGPRTLSGLVTGDDGSYGGNLRKEQAETERFSTAHPIAAPVLEGVGGAIVPIGVLGAAAQGTTLGAKTLIGAGVGGGVGAVQGALASKDWTNLPQLGKDTAIGGGTGAVLGGMIPGTAKVVGNVYERVANALTGKVDDMSRGAGSHLIKAVEADGPAAVQARVAELGPDAMLGDAGPALLGKLQGASLNSDEGRSIATNALKTRDVGTNARIQLDVNRALGPAEDPQTVTRAIEAHRSAVDGVNYPAALGSAPPIQAAQIVSDLTHRIEQAPIGSPEHTALTRLQRMVVSPEGAPITDASVLHKVKGVLDNVIEYDGPGLGTQPGALRSADGALRQLRGAINSALETQVPGYANANRVSAALAQRQNAVEAGTQYLGSGKTTPSPDRFATDFNPLPQGEKIAFAKGSRGEVERVLGTKANDLQALRGELQGEGGWNTAKIATVHGQPAADELAASVDRNLKFRDTHQKVVEGSQTDIRNAARKEMKPDPSTDTPLLNPNSTLVGVGATVAKKGLQSVVNALTRSDPTRHYGEVARALTEQGAARDARLMAVVEALNSRQGNAVTASTAGDIGAVTAALLGKSAADELRNGPMRRQQ